MVRKGYRNPVGACSTGLEFEIAREKLPLAARDLAHQRQQVAFAVAEKRHPKIVLWHWRDDVRRILKFSPGFLETPVRRLNIADLEIKDRTRMIEFRFLRLVQHQPYSATIEKRQLAGAEQMRQSQDVAIECRGAIHVVRVDGNLPDARQGRVLLRVHGCLPPGAD